MRRLILRRLILVPVLILAVSFGVFSLVSLMPGDPAAVLAGDNPQLAPYIRETLRLDDPFFVRYGTWLSNALHGDLGQSFVLRGQPVSRMIEDGLAVTTSLAILAILWSIVISMVLGVIAALRQGRLIDRVITAVSAAAIASPSFWLGYLGVLWFAIDFSWFPAIGYVPFQQSPSDWLWHLALPSFVLALNGAAVLTLQLRGAMIETLKRDYILSARAKGLAGVAVVGKHALKNAISPVATLLGFQLAQLLGGAVVVETVFNLQGLGSLALSGALSRDVPVLLGIVVLTTLVVSVINLLVDISYGYLNPKLGEA